MVATSRRRAEAYLRVSAVSRRVPTSGSGSCERAAIRRAISKASPSE